MINVQAKPLQDRAATIDTLVSRIVEEYSPYQVILFGSHAYGEPDSDSDIDLFILKETTERFIDRWTRVQMILAGLSTSVGVDTIVLTPSELQERLKRGDQWIEEILHRGKIIYDHAERLVIS